MGGIFISIEGMDGSGKSTQIQFLTSLLQQHGFRVILTREPGGTRIGEKIRTLLLDPQNGELSSMTEVLLYAAARAQHVNEVIKPALKENMAVICDRFTDSSIAYQGYGRGYGHKRIEELNLTSTENMMPEITFFLDVSPEYALKRKKQEQGHQLDRMEQEKMDFHKRVYEGYLELCALYPDRIKKINAFLPIEQVSEQIKKELEKVLLKRMI